MQKDLPVSSHHPISADAHGPDGLDTDAAVPTQRLFFALWPSEQSAREIMAWARDAHAAFGGRMMRPETLHLTLAFLGSTPADRTSELVSAAASWPAAVQAVTLRRFGRFTGPRIVWAGPSEGESHTPAWLDDLYDALWGRLERHGWERPPGVFRPHVSLLRKAEPGDVSVLQRPPLTWMPAGCVLVASQPREGGSHYQVLARMPLRTA